MGNKIFCKTFPIEAISKYRTELMGFATLLILIAHIHLIVGDTQLTLFLYRWSVSQGVEMFFLLSGIGLSYSLSSHEKRNDSIIAWYKRRFTRILVPYLIIATPWYCAKGIANGSSVYSILYELSTISYWTDSVGAWYIALLLPLYLLSPVLYRVINGRWGTIITFSLIFLMISYKAWPLASYSHCLSVICKSHCFILGMYLYRFFVAKTNVNLFCVISLATAFMICMQLISDRILSSWAVILVYMPLMCYLFESSRKIKLLFSSLGKISLESYLTNVALVSLIQKITLLNNWGGIC